MTRQSPADGCRGLLDRVQIRGIDADKRTATFVAATENGVETYYGTEHLRMAGVDLARFRRNPVVLDTHNRYEAGAVIGKAAVKIEGRNLIAKITFADTARAEEVWRLVSTGFLQALSIGFIARDVQVLDEAESAGDGAERIEGPARVVRAWELYEVSVVPVPADAEALQRSFFERQTLEGVTMTLRDVTDGELMRALTGNPGLPDPVRDPEDSTAGASTTPRTGAPQTLADISDADLLRAIGG
ncbi:MAG: hypothetical protein GY842_13865 [bacterium]|nr:hypothetical protein [bacterium]